MLSRSGEWRAAPPLPGAVLINVRVVEDVVMELVMEVAMEVAREVAMDVVRKMVYKQNNN